jgi:hypothetical protein
MQLLSINVALELSREIARTAISIHGVHSLPINGFLFTYEPDARQSQGIEVANIDNGDPFLSDWLDKDGNSEPCRIHIQRYDFPTKVLQIAIKLGIIRIPREDPE